MAPLTIRALAALVLAAATLPALAQKKSGADYSIQEFFRRADYQNMQLSPNGERLAATIPYKGRANLVVIDLGKRSRSLISSFESMDVGQFYWVNSDRLCMRVAESQDVTGAFNFRGTFCVDHDGQNLRDFTKLGAGMTPLAAVGEGSPAMLVAFSERSRDSLDAFRLDTLSGKYEIITRDSPGDVASWIVDRAGVPRIAVSFPERRSKSELRKQVIWYRDGAGSKWEKINEFDIVAGTPQAEYWEPVAFDFDNTTLYVTGRVGGRDRAAIYKYDTKARKLGDVMFEDPIVDVEGGLVFSRGQKKLLGIRYQSGKPVVRWVDDGLDRIQKAMDATFPQTVNEIRLPADSLDRALVFSASDRDPGSYKLFDRKRNGVEELVKAREWIDPAHMAERRFITYKARDGREIPAYLTLPQGAGKNLPLIVHVHGGPNVRGYTSVSAWGRWPDAQFFASRGYAVLEPEPRGSTGYGYALYRAGWKQWGLTAQDDLNDGALHLAKEGIADRGRMCIIGASYGGYASAAAAARDSDLWKCAVPYLAVTDLFLLQNVTYTDIASGDYQETDFLRLIGDPRADKEMMTRSSPALNGDKVKIPVFLAMGGADVRVPEVHGAAFYNAVTKAGGKIEYKVYNGEAHGFNKDANVFDFYGRVEKFFAEHLKK